jgi:hypothetical protein
MLSEVTVLYEQQMKSLPIIGFARFAIEDALVLISECGSTYRLAHLRFWSQSR